MKVCPECKMCFWYFEASGWADSDGNDILEMVCANPKCGASFRTDKINSLEEEEKEAETK